MSLVLLILGILATGAGIVTIGFGIPISEFNLGATMIVAGTTATAAGLILVGLAAAVEQLTQIAKAARTRPPIRPMQPQSEPSAPPVIRPPTPQLPVQPAVPIQAAPPIQAPSQAPIHAPVPQVRPAMPPVPPRGLFAKPKGEPRGEPRNEPRGEEHVDEPAAEPPFSAIERLRASLVRADHTADEPATSVEGGAFAAPAAAPPPRAAPVVNPGAGIATNGAVPPPATPEAPKKPPLDFLFRARSRAPQPEAFDEVWPKRGPRQEPSEAAAAPAPAAAEAPAGRQVRQDTLFDDAGDDSRPAAVLKSGVVDGMAYTLYADGSIEAQLPQGTVRFGSIAELRSHIENST
jgi:hypothetical protein